MTGKIELLTDIHEIFPCSAALPNGENAYAVKEGSLL